MLNIILIIILVLFVLLFLFLIFSGLLAKVNITEQEIGPLKFVYAEHKGAYSKVGPVMDKVYEDLKKDGIETKRGIGIYYDNPQKVAKEDLRSEIGSIIETEDYEKIKDTHNVKDIISKKRVVAEFPYKNKVSIIIGVFKVYPKLMKYITDNNHKEGPIIELYDISNKKIQYILYNN